MSSANEGSFFKVRNGRHEDYRIVFELKKECMQIRFIMLLSFCWLLWCYLTRVPLIEDSYYCFPPFVENCIAYGYVYGHAQDRYGSGESLPLVLLLIFKRHPFY